jgi:hypothetical protein
MGLFDPKWKYVHSTATDIRKTFAKARRDLAKKQRSDPRLPKLQLMRAPSISPDSNSGSAPASRHHDTRSAAADGSSHRTNGDRPGLAAVRRDRCIPWW